MTTLPFTAPLIFTRKPAAIRNRNKYQAIIAHVQHEIAAQPNRHIQTEYYFAKKYLIGQVTLLRHFKSILGITLAAYRHQHCMLKAKELLSQGASMGGIADSLGYSDATNFTKAFRDYYGVSPSWYRQSCQVLAIAIHCMCMEY